MVKDRENNDKLLVCAQENNVYLWKTTDGKVYVALLRQDEKIDEKMILYICRF